MLSHRESLGSDRGVCFLMDSNQELPLCGRAGEVEQTTDRQEQRLVLLAKGIMSGQFHMFSRKYSREEISLEIMFVR